MGRFSVRIRRVMLLAAAFAVAAALSGVTAAHATTASGSGTPCSFGACHVVSEHGRRRRAQHRLHERVRLYLYLAR